MTEIYGSRIYKSKGNRSTGTLVWSHASHWTGVATTSGRHRANLPTFRCMRNIIWKTKPRNPREILAFVLQSLKHSRCLHSFEIYAIERKPALPTGRIRADVVAVVGWFFSGCILLSYSMKIIIMTPYMQHSFVGMETLNKCSARWINNPRIWSILKPFVNLRGLTAQRSIPYSM